MHVLKGLDRSEGQSEHRVIRRARGPHLVKALLQRRRHAFRRSIAADGVVCNAEAANNLDSWSSTAGAVTWVSNTHNGDGTLTCTWRCTAPINGSRQFMRLKVSKP